MRSATEKPQNHWKLFLWAASGILALWVISLLVISEAFGKPSDAGQFGDLFGSVNALFSGLAFAAIIVTLRVQMLELKQNTEELHNQANALDIQSELMRLSAQLSALPVLIAQEKSRIETIAPDVFGGFPHEAYSPVEIQEKIKLLKSELVQDNVQAIRLEKLSQDPARKPDPTTENFPKQIADLKKSTLQKGYVIPSLEKLEALTKALEDTFKAIQNLKTQGGSKTSP